MLAKTPVAFEFALSEELVGRGSMRTFMITTTAPSERTAVGDLETISGPYSNSASKALQSNIMFPEQILKSMRGWSPRIPVTALPPGRRARAMAVVAGKRAMALVAQEPAKASVFVDVTNQEPNPPVEEVLPEPGPSPTRFHESTCQARTAADACNRTTQNRSAATKTS